MGTHYPEVAPIAMLRGEFVWFEWNRVEIETHGTIAKGSAAWVRRGYGGGRY